MARIDAYFDAMPRRYFVSHTAAEIARHAMVVFQFSEDRLISTSLREVPEGFTIFTVCARDEHGLYGKIAGSLTALDINILSSQVYSTREGLALEIYRVTTPPGSAAQRRAVWERLDQTLKDVLSGRRKLDVMVQHLRRPIGRGVAPSPRPPSVVISNEVSDFYTVVDLSANDRLGLLYDLTRTIAAHGIAIYLSRATTVLDQVADTFYLKNRDGKKLTDPGAVEALREDLLRVISEDHRDG
jgi:[protein-PII] uridylyltransferase